ncbi:enoyl-CoA hydratase/isomerase family protein [Bacillus sp. D12]|uniref:enoyl-CoA hydratase/isomerase family protein n=1 Tax=Bacillaceae TaxID=186817 RepID=UPI0035C0ACD1
MDDHLKEKGRWMMEHLLIKEIGSVLVLTLNRPESLNAFSPEMITGLISELKKADKNPNVKVIILNGAGRAFSAGGDVKTMGTKSAATTYEYLGVINECILTMKEIETPIIAAVHGFAAGAAFNLALASDLIVAAEGSKFVLSFSQVGLISDAGGSYFLPRLVGPHLAKQFFFSAEPIPAERLYELGVINKLVPLEALRDEAIQYATMLSHGPGKAYGQMKKLIDYSFTATLEDVLERERITQTMMIATEDHQEGVSAFKEKRKPQFTGK